MAVTTNRRRQDPHRDRSRLARHREMVEAVLLLAALIVLAILAKLPAG